MWAVGGQLQRQSGWHRTIVCGSGVIFVRSAHSAQCQLKAEPTGGGGVDANGYRDCENNYMGLESEAHGHGRTDK